jgi:23S rRNA pseudoU1915 N3-methylase RlmH
MKIHFFLFVEKSPKDSKKAVKNYFKLDLCHSLFLHYTDRINFYRSVETKGLSFDSFLTLLESEQSAQIFCCDLGPKTKNLSSEEVARRFQDGEVRGSQNLYVLLGPANGFTAEQRGFLQKKNALFWNLGAQTLPHDLAAVVASEQIYRAMTILKGEPYHLGHL